MVELKEGEAILYINRSSSVCGACCKSADPQEEVHGSRLGYTPGEGCGAKFVYLSTHYAGIDETVKSLRPDLHFLSPLGEELGALLSQNRTF